MLTTTTSSTDRFALFATVLLTLALLPGCSGGPPSEDEAGAKLDELIQERSDGAIRLTDFGKTDGQSREESGVAIYEMEMEGAVEISEDCYWASSSRGMMSVFSTAPGMPSSSIGAMNPEYSMRTRAAKGEQHSFAGSMTFEQKESGWSLADVKISATGD